MTLDVIRLPVDETAFEAMLDRQGAEPELAAYCCALACSLADANQYDPEAWVAQLGDRHGPALRAYCEEHFRASAEDDQDDDDAEVLCDCRFTLAYGSKILLHDTNLKLRRGRMYGLLGGNERTAPDTEQADARIRVFVQPARQQLARQRKDRIGTVPGRLQTLLPGECPEVGPPDFHLDRAGTEHSLAQSSGRSFGEPQ